MSIWKGRSKRKPSGGRYWPFRKKRKSEIGKDPVYTKVGETKRKQERVRSGKKITRLLNAEFANIIKDKKATKVKILSVKENPANRHFVRQNIITKGAIIETETGLAKVTSKPTKHGLVNAIPLKK